MYKLKAFISYSHSADPRLAKNLQWHLEQLGKPLSRRRAIDIFRDETDLSANPELWHSIKTGLVNSEYFLLLASPRAAKSEWVQKEVDYWLSNRDRRKLLIVLTHGDLAWDDLAHDFNWTTTNALPLNLQKSFAGPPFWVDLRWARGKAPRWSNPKFRDAVATIASTLRGVPKRDLESADLRQHLKLKDLRSREVNYRHRLLAQGLAAQSALMRVDQPKRIELSLLLAVESLRRVHMAENEAAVRESLRLLPKCVARGAAFQDLAFGSESNVAAVLRSGKARIVNLPDGAVRVRVAGARSVVAFALSPDGRYLAVGSSNGTIEILDPSSAESISRLEGILGVKILVISPNSKYLAVGTAGHMAKLFRLPGLTRVWQWKVDAPVGELAFSPDNRYVAVKHETTQILSIRAGKDRERDFEEVSLGPSGRYVAADSGRAQLIEARTGKELAHLTGDRIGAVAISPNGAYAAASGSMPGRDKTCRIFHASSGEQMGQLPPHEDIIVKMKFSPDSRHIATVTEDGTVRVFEAPDFGEIGRLPQQGPPHQSYL
jgi:hypothetical protein